MDTSALEKRIKTNLIYLNESEKRKYLASEACALGRGGIRIVSEISGLHRNSITAGLKEINDPNFKGSSLVLVGEMFKKNFYTYI